MENFVVSIRCIAPILIIMALGIWLRSCKLVPDKTYDYLSKVCFHGLLPFQLFYNIYNAQLGEMLSPKLLSFLEVGILLWFAINYALFSIVEHNPKVRGAYIQNTFRSNVAVVGVSLAQTMLGTTGAALMSLAIAVLVPTYNVLAVITLETCRGSRIQPTKTLKMILDNPLIRACVLGILFLFLDVQLPQSVEQAVKNIGSAGSTMTLVTLGASLNFNEIRNNTKRVVFCCVYRLILTPLVMVTAALALGFRGNNLGIILICTGAPMATTSYPMALACDSDHELTAQVIVATSLVFCFSMLFWIFTLKRADLL